MLRNRIAAGHCPVGGHDRSRGPLRSPAARRHDGDVDTGPAPLADRGARQRPGVADPTTAAWESALATDGVQYTEVDAVGTAPNQTITLPTLSTGTTGYFNGVVFADSPTDFASGQLTALYTYESTFLVNQLDGYMFPNPALGATEATSGALDGTTGTLTAAGLADFPELAGPIPFATGTYGYGAGR